MRDNERIYFGDMLVKLGDLISSESFDEFDKAQMAGIRAEFNFVAHHGEFFTTPPSGLQQR